MSFLEYLFCSQFQPNRPLIKVRLDCRTALLGEMK
jgi:hypothetical protein